MVVDNASSDGTPDLVASLAAARPALKLVEMGRNAGYAAGVNAGFAAAPGRDVLLVNPDVALPGPEPVGGLVALAEAHPRLAVVGPRLVSEDGSVQASARRYPSLAAVAATFPRIGGLGPLRRSRERYEDPSLSDAPAEVDWVIGAAMLIRRDAYELVGGWDESYFLYLEDTDFCRRCRRVGRGVAYLPSVRLVHRYPQSTSRPGASALRSEARRRHMAGFARFFARHPGLALGRGRAGARKIR